MIAVSAIFSPHLSLRRFFSPPSKMLLSAAATTSALYSRQPSFHYTNFLISSSCPSSSSRVSVSFSSHAFHRTPYISLRTHYSTPNVLPNRELLNRNEDFNDEIDTEDEECEEETLELGEIESATPSVITKSEDCELIELNEDFDDEESEEEEMESDVSSTSSVVKRSEVKLPNLSAKEKKELASYAHSLGKKLKSQQVGKSGVTDSVAFALIETLEANELLKLKIHGSCPGELPEVVRQLEQATGSIAVGQIGRSVILYRPSLSKMKAEEKKRQAQRIFLRKKSTGRPSIQKNELALRSSRRGRRGSSRFS